jgi:hypothetical protein
MGPFFCLVQAGICLALIPIRDHSLAVCKNQAKDTLDSVAQDKREIKMHDTWSKNSKLKYKKPLFLTQTKSIPSQTETWKTLICRR